MRLRSSLDFNPNDHDAYADLRRLLVDKGALRAAVVLDATWIKNNPADYSAWIDLDSTASIGLHDPEYAIVQTASFLRHAPHDDPNYGQPASRLAHRLARRQRATEALTILDALIAANLDSELQTDRVYPLLLLGRTEEALHSLRSGVAASPDSEGLRVDLADLLYNRGAFADAASEYRAALAAYDAKYRKGEVTSTWDHFIAGMVEAEKNSQSERVLAAIHLKLARCLAAEKKWDDAVEQTKLALNADKEAYQALFLKAQILEAKGDFKTANQVRTDVMAALSKQIAAAGAGADVKKAITDPRFILLMNDDDDSTDLAPLTFAGEVVAAGSINEGRLSAFERLLYGNALAEKGRVDDADQQWNKAIASDRRLDNARVQAQIGQRLLSLGSGSKAAPHLRRAYELDPLNMTYRIDFERAKEADSP